MAKIWGLPREHSKVKILTNALSQPIGRTKSTFVEFIGSVARNGHYAPIHLKSWHHMPLNKKKDMLAIVKEKFEVPSGIEYWMVKAIGRRWKNWKANLKKRYYKADVPLHSLVQITDSRVVKEQWKEIISYWRTDEAKAVMDEMTSKLPVGFNDEIAPDDVFAQVIGKDRNGSVRMMGGGVAPSDLWDSFPSRGASYRMAMEYKSAFEQQTEINKKLMAEVEEIRAMLNQNGILSARSASSVQQHFQTSRPLQVNAFVAMKSHFDSSKTVAEGILESFDPACVVGGQVLGKGWCSILVQVMVDPLEELIRPFDMFETIGDVVGISVAWPKHLVG